MDDTAVDVPIVADEVKPVEVVIDKGADAGAVKTAPVVSADEGIESLKAQVEKAKRDSAERLAAKDRIIADAFKQANEAQREVVTVKRDQVGTIIEKLTADKDAARRDYRTAMEAGDFDKAAEAQDRIATTAARIVKAEEGKMALEDEAKNPPRALVVNQDNDPVERLARSMGSQKSANWIRQHPEQVLPTGALSPKALAAHYAAIDQGHAEDSDGYFAFIEGQVATQPRQNVAQDSLARGEGRDMSRAPTSAPVGRDAPQTPGAQRPGSMTLQPSEIQTAIDTYGPLYPKINTSTKEGRNELLQHYVRDKQALIDEGKIARRA